MKKTLVLLSLVAVVACNKQYNEESTSVPTQSEEITVTTGKTLAYENAVLLDMKADSTASPSTRGRGSVTVEVIENPYWASSQEMHNENGLAWNLFDGNLRTTWHTQYSNLPAGFNAFPAWVEFPLGRHQGKDIVALRLFNRTFNPYGHPKKIKIEYKNAYGQWVYLGSGSGSSSGGGVIERPGTVLEISNDNEVFLNFSSILYRPQAFRIHVLSTHDNHNYVSLAEVQIFASDFTADHYPSR